MDDLCLHGPGGQRSSFAQQHIGRVVGWPFLQSIAVSLALPWMHHELGWEDTMYLVAYSADAKQAYCMPHPGLPGDPNNFSFFLKANIKCLSPDEKDGQVRTRHENNET